MRSYLKSCRENMNITMKQMGEKINISESYYFLIENGERQKDMSLSLMEKLAGAFNLPLDEIIKAEKEYQRALGQKGA